MPIDEAEGLGTNFDLLYDIAQEFDYQIISFSINPIGRYQENERFIYIPVSYTHLKQITSIWQN